MTGQRDGAAGRLPGMPARLFGCTPSRLAAFDCPRRYHLSYLQRPAVPRGPAWAHSSLGAAVHVALSRWWDLPTRSRTPEAANQLVHRHWQPAGFRDEAQARRWAEVAGKWVQRYTAGLDPRSEPLGVERTVAATSPALALSGRVDRIDRRGDEAVVVDYKTGRHRCTADDARGSAALALYVLAVRRTLRMPCRRVELHHLPSGTVAEFEHDEQSLARHLDRAEATAHDIVVATDTLHAGAGADEVFPPMTGPACSWCDFRRHCPEGRAAAPDRDPWSGLPDEPGEPATAQADDRGEAGEPGSAQVDTAAAARCLAAR